MNKMKSNRNLSSLIQFVVFITVQANLAVTPAQVMTMEMPFKEIEIQKNYTKRNAPKPRKRGKNLKKRTDRSNSLKNKSSDFNEIPKN